MTKVQKVERDLEVFKEPNATRITVKTVSKGRYGLYFMALLALAVVGTLALIVGIIMMIEGAGGGFIVILISAGSFYGIKLMSNWANKRVARDILISDDGIETDGKLYPFSDIDEVRWVFGTDGIITKSATAASAHQHMSEISGVVEIAFGNKQIKLATGLREHEVERVYQAVVDAMRAHGYVFRDKT